MTRNLANLEIQVLEKMYLKEIEVLKLKLLSGAFLKDIRKQRNKAIQVALVIHQKQMNNVAPFDFTLE